MESSSTTPGDQNAHAALLVLVQTGLREIEYGGLALHLGNYGVEEQIPHVHGVWDHQVLTRRKQHATSCLWKAPADLLASRPP